MVMGENSLLCGVSAELTKSWKDGAEKADRSEISSPDAPPTPHPPEQPVPPLPPTLNSVQGPDKQGSPARHNLPVLPKTSVPGNDNPHSSLLRIAVSLDNVLIGDSCDKKSAVKTDTSDDCFCIACGDVYQSLDLCQVHFHQIHVNPNQLTTDVAKKFRISNFVENTHEDKSAADQNPTYRCHECFNVFSLLENLKVHLVSHNMAPKTEYLNSVPEYSQSLKKKTVLHRKRRRVSSNNRQENPPEEGKSESARGRPRRLAALKRLLEMDSEISDEFNSNSENEGDLSNRRSWRPQRECKTRTKTLVAISLAEQEYEKFDLGTSIICITMM